MEGMDLTLVYANGTMGLFGKASKAALLEYSTPDTFNKIAADTLAETLRLASRNRVGLAKAEALTLRSACSKLCLETKPLTKHLRPVQIELHNQHFRLKQKKFAGFRPISFVLLF